MMPATKATIPATAQTITQIWFSGMPTESAAWWSSAGPQRAPDTGVGEEEGESGDEQGRDHRLRDVELLDHHVADEPRAVRNSDVDRPHVSTPDGSPKPSRKKAIPMVDMNRMIGG